MLHVGNEARYADACSPLSHTASPQPTAHSFKPEQGEQAGLAAFADLSRGPKNTLHFYQANMGKWAHHNFNIPPRASEFEHIHTRLTGGSLTTLLQVSCYTNIFSPLLTLETGSTEAQAGLRLTM